MVAEVEIALRSCIRHDPGNGGNIVHVGIAGTKTLKIVLAAADPNGDVVLVTVY